MKKTRIFISEFKGGGLMRIFLIGVLLNLTMGKISAQDTPDSVYYNYEKIDGTLQAVEMVELYLDSVGNVQYAIIFKGDEETYTNYVPAIIRSNEYKLIGGFLTNKLIKSWEWLNPLLQEEGMDTDTTNWSIWYKYYADFNSDGKLLWSEDYYYDWNESKWEGDSKVENAFLGNGTPLSQIRFKWNAGGDNWVEWNGWSHEYSLDDIGETIETVFESHQLYNGTWNPENRTTEGRDLSDRLEYEINQRWEDDVESEYYNQWVNQSKVYYSYHPTLGKILSKEVFDGEGTEWSMKRRFAYTYNGSGTLVEYQEYKGDGYETTGSWLLDVQNFFEQSGFIFEERFFVLDEVRGVMKGVRRNVVEEDASGRMILQETYGVQIEPYGFEGVDWECVKKIAYNYEPSIGDYEFLEFGIDPNTGNFQERARSFMDFAQSEEQDINDPNNLLLRREVKKYTGRQDESPDWVIIYPNE